MSIHHSNAKFKNFDTLEAKIVLTGLLLKVIQPIWTFGFCMRVVIMHWINLSQAKKRRKEKKKRKTVHGQVEHLVKFKGSFTNKH